MPLWLKLFEQFSSRIFRIQLGKLAQQFFRLLIPRHRHGYFDFNNLIAADAIFCGRGHAFFSQSKFLPGLRSRRNPEHSTAIDRRDFDLRSQRRFSRGDRHSELDVIPLAVKHRVVAGADDDVQIAAWTAAKSRVTFPAQPDALAIASPGLDPHFERFGALYRTFAMADRAGGNVLAGSVAAGAGNVELHTPALLRDLSGAVALGALPRRFNVAFSVTVSAYIAASYVQAHHAAPNRRPEGNVDLVFKIRTRFGTFVHGCAASAEDAGKDVFETAAAAAACARLPRPPAFEHVGKIKPFKVKGNFLARRPWLARRNAAARKSAAGPGASVGLGGRRINIVRVKTNLIVDFALLGIAQNIIGFRHRLELLFSHLVARVDVGMVLASKLAESLANVLSRGRLLYSEQLVIVFFGGGGHLYWIFRLPFLNVSAHSCLAAST